MNMALDLVDQFASELVSTPDSNTHQSLAFGTFKIIGSDFYVLLDGSDDPVPASTTVKALDNDRVIVLLKDRKAFVFGNFSRPSGSTSESDGYLKFHINEDGCLICQRDPYAHVDFYIKDGSLYQSGEDDEKEYYIDDGYLYETEG